ncbi:PAS domain S-box protein [Geomonas sp. Red32]|uniref:PAS domain-containing protein n=1 Tax=Geomonas sp. Red32 TaxID=2912856 RepID=UPI00202CDB31|nr:PAS domain-containing protein [Geomonas sp. Red32]MCM0083041.1 PAS domain S-box protein [Geomonas sp. Red32]
MRQIYKRFQPLMVFAILMVVIFLVEALIMLLLPHLLLGEPEYYQDLADASLLAVLCAPFLWLMIIRPLRAAAMDEVTQATLLVQNMESAVSEQAEFSSQLVDNLVIPCFVIKPDHTVIVWNKACEALTGLNPAAMVGKNKQWKAFFGHEEKTLADMVADAESARGNGEAPLDSGLRSEGWYPNIGGKRRYLAIRAVPLHNKKNELIAVIETFEDVTDRKLAEEAVRCSEEKFFKAFQCGPDAVVISRKADGTFLEANESFFRMLGYVRDEIIGHASLDIGLWVNPEQRTKIVSMMEDGGEAHDIEIHLRAKSGAVVTCLWSSAVIDFKSDECLIVNLRDITAVKENERQLKKSRAELLVKHEQLAAVFRNIETVKREWELTIDCIKDIVVLLDSRGRVKRCNLATATFFGFSVHQVTGRVWTDLLRDKDFPEPAPEEQSREVYHEMTGRWFLYTSYPYPNDDPRVDIGAVVTVHDTTQRKRAAVELEKAYSDLKETHAFLLQQEKMASLGQLAAGIAHEINNPTGFIISNLGTMKKYGERLVQYLGLLQEEAGSPPPAPLAEQRKLLKIDRIIEDLPSLVAETMEGADRMKKIVQDMKGFSRSDSGTPVVSDLRECLESTINIVWNELKYKARLTRKYGDIPPVTCYPQQLNQVFMNLLVNAAHAIEKDGEIVVATRQEGDFIYIAISDTGCGIPEENLTRIFEPFFTTKEAGKGTGLGLSISYAIVQKHGGDLWAESTVGSGTTFHLRLPLAPPAPPLSGATPGAGLPLD